MSVVYSKHQALSALPERSYCQSPIDATVDKSAAGLFPLTVDIGVPGGACGMAVSENFREFVLEQLGRVVPVTAKPMFGGVGVYSDGLFFALIAEDRLYFKVDDLTRPEFERLGMKPFRPSGEDKAKGYYEVPANLIENPAELAPWADKAIAVARHAKRTRGTRKQ